MQFHCLNTAHQKQMQRNERLMHYVLANRAIWPIGPSSQQGHLANRAIWPIGPSRQQGHLANRAISPIGPLTWQLPIWPIGRQCSWSWSLSSNKLDTFGCGAGGVSGQVRLGQVRLGQVWLGQVGMWCGCSGVGCSGVGCSGVGCSGVECSGVGCSILMLISIHNTL